MRVPPFSFPLAASDLAASLHLIASRCMLVTSMTPLGRSARDQVYRSTQADVVGPLSKPSERVKSGRICAWTRSK